MSDIQASDHCPAYCHANVSHRSPHNGLFSKRCAVCVERMRHLYGRKPAPLKKEAKHGR
jgi:hypothetical protein